MLEADAVDCGNIHSVCDGVGALDGSPCVELRGAELIFLRRVPADGRGIEQNFGTLKSGEPRALGIPLVPADERAYAAGGGVDGLKAEIAGGKVILFVIKRVVRDVHFAVDAGDLAIGVERDGSVVVKSWRAALEERSDDGDFGIAGNFSQFGGGGSGDGLGKIEEAQIFALAKILRAEEFGQADDLRAELRGLADVVERGREVRLGVRAH